MPDTSIEALPPLRDVIAVHGLSARKSLGQNFILDLNLTDKIAAAAGDLTGAKVLEIGPGPGGLSRSILKAGAAMLTVVERDRRCLAALAELDAAAKGRLRIVEADAMTVDERPIVSPGTFVIANLPYNIATALLFKWLDKLDLFAGFTLMFQKEVAQRITAQPGGKNYGRLAIMSQWLCHAELAFDIPPQAFVPPPKVTSSVVRLSPRDRPLAPAAPDRLSLVVRTAFSQRRKMLRTSLRPIFGDPIRVLSDLGIEPTARPETLPIDAFCALARCEALAIPRANS